MALRPGSRVLMLESLLVFAVALALRLIWIEGWLLPNVDEIVLTNTLKAPILESATPSSSYWLPQLIYKTFSPGLGTVHFRYLSALAGASTCLILYLALKRLLVVPAALPISLAFSFQWYSLYITRIAEIASLLPLMLTAALVLLMHWDRSRSLPTLLAATGLLALALNTWAPPAAYLSASTSCYLCVELQSRRLSLRSFAAALLVWVAVAAPYIVATARSGNLRAELLTRYSFSGAAAGGLVPAALVNPGVPARTWSQLATVYRTDGPDWTGYCAGAVVLIVGLVLGAKRQEASQLRLVALLGGAMLLLLLVSPLPAYIEGHLFPLLLLLVFVLAGGLQTHVAPWRRLTSALGLSLLFLPSLTFIPRLWADQRGALEHWLTQEADASTAVFASDGARLKLEAYPEFAPLRSRLQVFACDGSEVGWHEGAQGDRVLVMTTYECNTEAMFAGAGRSVAPGPDLNSLLEASLKHGLRGWVVPRSN